MAGWTTSHLVLQGNDYSMLSTADALLAVGGHLFPVHSQILSFKSAYFRGLFEDLGFGSPDDKPVVPLEDVQPDDLSNVLRYIYHGELQLGSKKELMRILMLAYEFKLDGYEEQFGKILNDPNWFMHCAGYPVGTSLSASHKAQPRKVPLVPGDENDAIQWLAAADAVEMQVLKSKCFAIILKFLSSKVDPEKEERVKDEAEKTLRPGLLYELARFALEVHGVNGICSCHARLPNGERICYSCAMNIVGDPKSVAGPSK